MDQQQNRHRRRLAGLALPLVLLVAQTTADSTEVRDVARVEVSESKTVSVTLMFDPDHNLEERILKEQFLP